MVRRTIIVCGLAGGLAGLSPAAAQQVAAPIGNPGEWFGPDSYPPEAMRLVQEGRVVAIITVNATGKPTACEIDISSGSEALDKGTCDIVMRKGAFTPAHDGRGRPTGGGYRLPVRWALPKGLDLYKTIDIEAGAATPTKLSVDLRITVSPDGTVASCTATSPTPEYKPDDGPCTMYPFGRKIMPAMTRGGRPVGAVIVQKFENETIYDR